MNWTDQAETMMSAWAATQQKAWEGWYELARGGLPNQTPSTPEMTDPFKFFQKGIEAWTSGTGPTGQGAADQIFNGQRGMLRTLELLTKAWGVVAPNLESGGDWQGQLQRFTDQWMEQVLGAPAHATETVTNSADLWQSYMGEWGPLLQPWIASASNMAQGHLGEGLLGGSSGLNRLLSLEVDGLSRLFNFEASKELAFERLSDIPSVGSSREQMAVLLRAFDAFVDLRKVSVEYKTLLTKSIGQALQKTMEDLAGMAKKGESIDSVRELNRLWLGVADDVFSDLYVSPEYTEMQRKLSSAGMLYKIEQQKVVEMALEMFHVPTRSELDDTYRTLYELRKEVKALRKEMQQLKALPQAAPAPRKATTKRKPAASKTASPASPTTTSSD